MSISDEEVRVSILKMIHKIKATKNFVTKLINIMNHKPPKPIKFSGKFTIIREDELLYLRMFENQHDEVRKMLKKHLDEVLKA